MSAIQFNTTDWSSVPPVEYKGVTGTATWRTIQLDTIRMRLVEYSAGYMADHWCKAGHLVYCLEGEFTAELSDGRKFHLSKGMSYHVSDNMSSHRSTTKEGVKLLIIDGDFLKHDTKQLANPWRM
jgi:quercetin dioxygenase-like cupin family protein